MTHLALAAVFLTLTFQEEPPYREKIEALSTQLEADPGAAQEISRLPAALAPLVRELAPAEKRPAAAKKLRELLPPDPWHRVFRGSIGSAFENHKSLYEGARSPGRPRWLMDALRGL